MKRSIAQYLVSAIVIVAALGIILLIDVRARNRRIMPLAGQLNKMQVTVDRQQDVYEIYKKLGLRGAKVIHLNRFLNLVEYYPAGEIRSAPFPIPVHDIRPDYESGLDSHNWLFIANRTGLVRTVTVVLPDRVFDEREGAFRQDSAFMYQGRRFAGYAQDLAILVTRMADLPATREPVVVNVDVGYFEPGIDPAGVAAVLRERCPDVRALVLVASTDEPGVTSAMKEAARRFESAWRRM